jgi:large subunit ribosomal protein L33
MAAKENRIIVTLACTDCRSRNYATTKHRVRQQGRMELKKFCPPCRKHTLHREQK